MSATITNLNRVATAEARREIRRILAHVTINLKRRLLGDDPEQAHKNSSIVWAGLCCELNKDSYAEIDKMQKTLTKAVVTLHGPVRPEIESKQNPAEVVRFPSKRARRTKQG